jgi:hypothetical protein
MKKNRLCCFSRALQIFCHFFAVLKRDFSTRFVQYVGSVISLINYCVLKQR